MTDPHAGRQRRPRALRLAVLAATMSGAAVVAGCSSPSGAPTAVPPSSPAIASSPASASVSGSQQAWVRGTHVTLTNRTASEVETKTWTLSGGEGTFAPLAPGESVSVTSEWSAVTGTEVVFYVKRPAKGVAALMVVNPDIGTPATSTCAATEITGCDSASSFSGELQYDENQTRTTSTDGGAATFTVTRNGDDDDNKNWTVSLDALS